MLPANIRALSEDSKTRPQTAKQSSAGGLCGLWRTSVLPRAPHQGCWYWTLTRLTAVLLCVWFFVSFVLIFFARDLNFSFFGWPFSFWVAAQGALLVYGVITWFYARRMSRLDDQLGPESDQAP